MKPLISIAAAGIAALVALTWIEPAQAAGCYYKAINLEGRVLDLRGVGHAMTQKSACNRARRECNRRLERAYKQGKLPRGVVCRRVA